MFWRVIWIFSASSDAGILEYPDLERTNPGISETRCNNKGR